MPLQRVPFMNTYIDNATLEEVLSYIDIWIKKRKIGQIITPNMDQIVRMEWDTYFKKICGSCELLLVDGQPLMWISHIYRKPFKEKICGSDLVPKLCEIAAKKNYKVFFLGAAPGVAEKAAANMQNKYKGLCVAGTCSPAPGFEKSPDKLRKVNEQLRASQADILFVGLGVPKQDIFIYENKEEYKIPVSLSVGGTIDFLAGVQKRAPKWINRIGFEWLFRFFCSPCRLFHRYFIDDMKIFKLIWKYRN